jgi:hypothetical protein
MTKLVRDQDHACALDFILRLRPFDLTRHTIQGRPVPW